MNYVLLETVMITLAMDNWSWNPQAAILRMGFITMGAGAMTIVLFGLMGPLSRRWANVIYAICDIHSIQI